jgi:hypothetical protein
VHRYGPHLHALERVLTPASTRVLWAAGCVIPSRQPGNDPAEAVSLKSVSGAVRS